MKEKILRILREKDQYVSGQRLCEELGVSRTAIWKYINQLKEDGYEIEAIQNKGYTITAYPDVVSEEELSSLFHNAFMGSKIFSYEVIDSTNNEAKRRAEEGAPHGTLVIAQEQRLGKGRRGKQWISPIGSGIWMSFILRPEISPQCASMITLVAAMAVAKGLKHIGLNASIKWPNDIVSNGKKISGILTEMSADPDFINYVVVGIGINVNTSEFPEEVSSTATSVFLESGKKVNRAPLIKIILEYFEEYYNIFMQTQNMEQLIEEYNKELINREKEVVIHDIKGQFQGVAIGIDESGALLVKKEDGKIHRVIAGEVSVRGLYGYI